jgi:hypothetical protein
MYACQGNFPEMLRLEAFTVSDTENPNALAAVSGEKILLRHNPRIRITIAGRTAPRITTVNVRLIRNGDLIEVFSGPLPLNIDYADTIEMPGKEIYYRVDMKGSGAIVSNPIFVRFEK